MVMPIADELRSIAKGEILSDDWSKDPQDLVLTGSERCPLLVKMMH